MYLDLTEILRNPGQMVERTFQLPAGELDEWLLLEPVNGTVRAANARRNIVVSGQAHTAIEMTCGRCLEPFLQPLNLELETAVPLSVFNQALQNSAVEENKDTQGDELNDEEIAALFSEHSLNLSELVRQAIVLQAPFAPNCSEDCPGLPEAQNYKMPEDDPRWAALQKLKQQPSPIADSFGDGEKEYKNGTA